MLPIPSPRPYRQGRLDALCGLYACINVQRRLQAIHQPWQKLPWRALFSDCLNNLNQSHNLAPVMACGLSLEQVWTCAQSLRDRLQTDYGIRTAIGRPLLAKGPVPTQKIFKSLATNLSDPHYSAMLCIKGSSFSHWTVISHLTPDHLHLYDSGGMNLVERSTVTYHSSSSQPPPCGTYFEPTGIIMIRRMD